jgi:putative FmdB family regulatory protein
MPIYEYECRRCGHRLENMQRISDPPLKRCPECRGALRKLISAPAFQFKGSGWYVTDYAGKKPAEGKGEGAAESKGEGAAESKGEAKTETQGEAKAKPDAAGGSAGSAGGGAGKGSKRAASGAD